MIPVILSGGSGTRLWPLSRPMFPKQFLSLTSDKTMFQETLMRIKGITDKSPIVIANNDHRFMAADNLKNLDYNDATIVLEEKGRNTAPAIAVASFLAVQNDEDAVLMVLPADHVIQDIPAFTKASKQAKKMAEEGYLVTFGIKPDTPNVNYGYIEMGEAIEGDACALKNFKEKPDMATAKAYLADDRYVWNSGIFVFKAAKYLDELKKYFPEIVEHAQLAIDNAVTDLDFLRLSQKHFEKCKNISIDYAVMENTDKGAVIPLDALWCDVGSWESLWSILPKDSAGNVTQGDVVLSKCRDSFIYSDNKFVNVIGVDNLIIADTKDALLIAHKNDVGDVKSTVELLQSNDRSEGLHHRTVYRPWGNFDLVDKGVRDQVKRVTVLPGQKLSTQMHYKRAEHWVVVKGTAKITKGDDILYLKENQSIYIPTNTKHSLENEGKDALEIIEIQTGEYLGEDDIVRFDDAYGRN